MTRNKPGLNLNMQDKSAAYAGYQYLLDRGPSPYRNIIRDEICRLIFSRYKWYGPTVHEANQIEYCLAMTGRVGIVKRNNKLYIGNVSVISDYVDFYGNPEEVMIVGRNGTEIRTERIYPFAIGFDTCAAYRNQAIIAPQIARIESYTDLIDNALQMWFVAAETRKCGLVFTVENQRQKTFIENVLSKISFNVPYIVMTGTTDGMANVSGDGALFAPSNTEALQHYHDNFINAVSFVLDSLGLENQPQNKQERLVVTEAMNNRNLSRYIGADGLKARLMLCDLLRERRIADWNVEHYLDSVGQESLNQASREGDVGIDV